MAGDETMSEVATSEMGSDTRRCYTSAAAKRSRSQYERDVMKAFEEQRKKQAADVDAQISAANVDVGTLIQQKMDRWGLSNMSLLPSNFIKNALTNFGMDSDLDIPLNEADLQAVVAKMEKEQVEVIGLLHAARRHDPECTNPELQLRAAELIRMVVMAKKAVLYAFQAGLAVHNAHCADPALGQKLNFIMGLAGVQFRSCLERDKMGPLQGLILHLLEHAEHHRYRKHAGNVYKPILSPSGHETHAWERVCSMQEFVYQSVRKEENFDEWLMLCSSGSNAKNAAEFLSNCNDLQFPFLHKDRTVFSFANGVYVAHQDRFYPFGGAESLSDTVVAANYFQQDFDCHADTPDWFDIPTPHLQSIMAYQDWEPCVQRIMYVMLGRLMYAADSRDKWQVAPFLLGSASSGKSTIALKVAKMFYEHSDVGIIANNMEKQFGISAFWDKLLVVGPEVKDDFSIDQGLMQQMISAESVSVSEKHKTAFSLAKWLVPIIFAGNEVPNFTDNQGSIQRRFIVFMFTKSVMNGDMFLGDKLMSEMAAIILKCNRAYLEAVEKWGNINIWTVLPQYFTDTRSEMAAATNITESFLNSDEVEYGEDCYCKLKDFRDMLKQFGVKVNIQVTKGLTKPFFNPTLNARGLFIVRDTRDFMGRHATEDWITGLALKNRPVSAPRDDQDFEYQQRQAANAFTQLG
jgi:phage/plasmid-associated DNA primase